LIFIFINPRAPRDNKMDNLSTTKMDKSKKLNGYRLTYKLLDDRQI